MFPAIFASVVSSGSTISSIENVVGGIFNQHPKDAERITRAKQYTTVALARGDDSVNAARVVLQQKDNSGSDVGKRAYRQAWLVIQSQAPDVAQIALSQGPLTGWELPAGASAGSASGIGGVLSNTQSTIQTALGNAVQQIGAGVTTAAASAVDPNHASRITIPTDTRTLVLIGLGLVVLFVLVRKAA